MALISKPPITQIIYNSITVAQCVFNIAAKITKSSATKWSLSLQPGMPISMLTYSAPEQESQLFKSSLLLIFEVYNGEICTSLTISKLKAMESKLKVMERASGWLKFKHITLAQLHQTEPILWKRSFFRVFSNQPSNQTKVSFWMLNNI